jgi:two-component system phosphate regulon sensor histidine kinase PhoR
VFEDSFVVAVRRAPPRRHLLLIGILLAIVFVLSVASAQLRLPGAGTAPWWPAAGFAVIAVLSARRHGVAIAGLVLVITAAANLAVGTMWWVALGFGLANAVEAWIVAAVMRVRRTGSRPFDTGDIVPLLLAAVAGSTAIGILAGLFVHLSGGSFVETAPHVAASHMSAILLIAALGVLPRRAFTVDRPLVLVVQIVVLAGTVAFAFAPNQPYPLAFLPLPALAWAAFRFGAGIVLIEIALTSVALLALSFFGGGTFARTAIDDPAVLAGLVQLYLMSAIVSLLPLAVVQDARSLLYLRLSAREQLLRGVIVNAHAGFVVVRRDDRVFRIVESNPTGMRLLAPWIRDTPDGTTLDPGELTAIAPGPEGTWTGEREFADGILVELVVSHVAGQRDILLIQAIDATEQRAASRAVTDALEHERRAFEQLRDLATQKDQFVSSVSHELRTPVTSILGYAEELDESRLDDGDRRSVDVILRNSRRLAELVDDLLSLSQMGAPTTYTAERIELSRVFAECDDQLLPLARAAGVALAVEAPADLAVLGDATWIDRVLTNLMTNAIKFTPDGGTVTVSAEATAGGTVRISVADSGRGIAPAELEKVFERFYRISDAERGFVPGTGLGLPIVRDLVTRMGGSVVLQSDGRHGTTAVVELPAARAAAELPRLTP